MFYAPHKLYVKRSEVERDEYGRPNGTTDKWTYVCNCRCDDNNIQSFHEEEGRVFRPKYHIVCPRGVAVNPNEDIKVFNGEELRGSGRVYNVRHLNMLDYSEIWV